MNKRYCSTLQPWVGMIFAVNEPEEIETIVCATVVTEQWLFVLSELWREFEARLQSNVSIDLKLS